MHLAIDGFGADPAKLRDEALVRGFLDEYPASIGMTKISPPHVYTYRGPVPEDWGVSGFVLIAESHISVHTFPDRGYINIDIFSCKEFDPAGSLDEVKSVFSLDDVKVWTLERGIEYSTARAAFDGIAHERVNLQPGLRSRDA